MTKHFVTTAALLLLVALVFKIGSPPVSSAAPITDPAAIAFANNYIRPMADQDAKHYYRCKEVVGIWNAQSMSTKILNTTDLIVDGSPADGRNQMTGANATAIITRCNEYISWMENGLVASPFLGSVTNATLNTVLLPAVNPNP